MLWFVARSMAFDVAPRRACSASACLEYEKCSAMGPTDRDETTDDRDDFRRGARLAEW